MKLTVNQIKDRLRVSGSTVRKLISVGKLTDLRAKTPGKRKHYALVDSKEVSEFAKAWVPRTYRHRPKPPRATVSRATLLDQSRPLLSVAGEGLLERIEKKLDRFTGLDLDRRLVALTEEIDALKGRVDELYELWKPKTVPATK